MIRSVRWIFTSNRNLTTTCFWDVLHVETPHNTAKASYVVSTAQAMVETTSSCNDSLVRKRYSSLMSMEDWQFSTTHPRRRQDWIKRTSLTKLRTRSEGIQNLKYFVDWLWVLQINQNFSTFWWMMGYEMHLRFLFTTVVKWTHKNKNVFVYVKCIYVTVGLNGSIFKD